MSGLSTRRSTCRLCASSDLSLAVPMGSSPVADAYLPVEEEARSLPLFSLDLFLCHRCGHVQLLEVVSPELLFGSYTFHTVHSLGLVEHFRRYSEEMLSRMGTARPFVVEIGSNDGTLLKFFAASGCPVLGVDPARSIASEATAAGIETIPEFFSAEIGRRIVAERGKAGFVAANNVFAHSDDLTGMADGIRELLSPEGFFVFEVSYLVDIVEKLLFDTVYHEHLCYHSVRPLREFFQSHGLELFEVQRIPAKAGSIRGFVQLAGGARPVHPSVMDLLRLEEQMGLAALPCFRNFTGRIDGTRSRLHSLLNEVVESGQRIGGFGASATVTTLLYRLGLHSYLDFLVDDNPIKHGLFSPGAGLPVYSSERLREAPPEVVLILAWNYAQPICKKHSRYAEEGGRFLVPLPEPAWL